VIKQGRLLSLLHRGDCFGEMAHLSEHEFKRSTDVIAKSETVLIEINPDVLVRASTGCRFQFSDAFLRMLVKRLAVANKRLSHLLADQDQTEKEKG
jgi:CRP-like cAMP-binding protein